MATFFQNAYLRILVTYALGVMAAMTVSEAVTELGAIAREFQINGHGQVGLIMSLPSLMVALGALLAGYTVDRFGDRVVLLIGALAIVTGDLLVIASPTFKLLLICRAITGVGYVLTAVAAVTLLIRITTGKQRTMAMALWSTFVPASFLLPFLTAGLAEHFADWRAAFLAHSILTLLLVVLAQLCLPRRSAEEKVMFSRTRGLRDVLRSPLPWLLGISFGADAFLQTGVITTLAPWLAKSYGVDVLAVSRWNVVAMVCNGIGCLMVGALLNRGVRATLIGAMGIVLTGLPALMIFSLQLGLWPSLVASWVFTFGSGLLVGMWALAPVVAPSRDSIGATSGLITQLTLIGVFLGPPLFFNALHNHTGHSLSLLVMGGLAVCLVGIPVWLRDPNHKPTVEHRATERAGINKSSVN
ncbi:putative MFS family arabinose efflux permease [Raoultella sp. BIGb0399]|uniref:MFS transporter n=1 Tax=Raoultella lignicola TaxID=3040939 RepID=A0ABU9FA85_9ENTR|nr:MFS transporter [Raoultella sp. BIGb0399]ROS15690.1 putative MFS family arabinose efflux permease [Raoultella sp. BIGb0399]